MAEVLGGTQVIVRAHRRRGRREPAGPRAALKRFDVKEWAHETQLLLAARSWPLPLSGCTCHSTDSTEVGVLTRQGRARWALGKPGVQEEIYAPGATYFFPVFFTDWNTFDVSLQNLAWCGTRRRAETGRRGRHRLQDDRRQRHPGGRDRRLGGSTPSARAYLLSKVGESTDAGEGEAGPAGVPERGARRAQLAALARSSTSPRSASRRRPRRGTSSRRCSSPRA